MLRQEESHNLLLIPHNANAENELQPAQCWSSLGHGFLAACNGGALAEVYIYMAVIYLIYPRGNYVIIWPRALPSLLHISGLSDFYSSRKVMLVIQCVQFAGNISRRPRKWECAVNSFVNLLFRWCKSR